MRGASGMEGAPKALLARALYNNDPDCSDELAFCKGDILTILEQHVPESEGWWRCLLHGKQGLAPANRLQILSEAPTDSPCPPFLRPLEEALASSKEAYQVPTVLRPPPLGPVYEPMKSWVAGPPPRTVQVYEFPDPPASARIVCEKMPSFSKQAIVPIPRPAQASLLTLYDVPAQSRGPSALKEPGKQQLYDIPASPRKAERGAPAGQPSRQSAPVTATVALGRACFKTLPNPQKSEWIYDTPVTPAKANVRNACVTGFVEESGSHALPRSMSSFHSPPNSRARSLAPHLRGNAPVQNPSLPEVPTCPSDGGVSYKVPLSFLIPRVEQQNTKPNIYDIPIPVPSAPRAGKEPGDADGASGETTDPHCACLSRQATWPSPEPDRLSVNSSDNRASITSSCSSMSTDSSCSSSSEESAKEFSLDLALAKGTATALQQNFLNWRLRDSLEANIDAIRRAADLITESLREFLDFARGVCGAAGNLPSSSLQARIRDQLQTISNSYHILLETKESLEGCHWSLDVLVTDKAQSSLDDLERFVMVARMVPEDIKRFTSIVIANGRLLFKQNGEKEETPPWAPKTEFKLAKSIQLPQREMESYQRSAPRAQQRESGPCPEPLGKSWASVCEKKLPNLEEKVKPILEQRLDENKDLETQDLSSPVQQDPGKKAHLSEHCRLYFGALFKAMGVLHSSLHHSQPPEILVAQSKLVITIGQKLVDTLCRETQDRDARNEILRGSSHLCSLLKDLALATKHAVLQRPSPTALAHLRAEADKLEQHARQFRGSLD
ncbi:PREDICTED: cas scaffolding protein family member 4 [Myotis davidii]|uniref:cas scaffolding protein family member 4 n=1 Tax=Myotis davidii TaxID=225400 RepID=UPI0003EC6172|nr:PREDICTED: cas scaffolding protein family member 4 [Myotis davidii]